MGGMIDNSDTPGHYQVRICARVKTVASFQCPTITDAHAEAIRIRDIRATHGWPTAYATAQMIREGGQLGPVIPLF